MSLRNRLFGGASRSVEASVAYRQLHEGAITLVDVRELDEWNAGHAAGARHMPLGRLDAAQLPADRPVVTVCRSGMRSARAASQLRAAGLEVLNLTGGMTAWVRQDLPIVAAGGKPARLA